MLYVEAKTMPMLQVSMNFFPTVLKYPFLQRVLHSPQTIYSTTWTWNVQVPPIHVRIRVLGWPTERRKVDKGKVFEDEDISNWIWSVQESDQEGSPLS